MMADSCSIFAEIFPVIPALRRYLRDAVLPRLQVPPDSSDPVPPDSARSGQ